MAAQAIRSIELREGEVCKLSTSELSQELATAIYKSGSLKVEFPSPTSDFQYQLLSTDTVGQFPIGRDVVIRVAPKVPIDNLFRMLEVAYRLESFKLHEGVVDVSSLPDLYERLASILARRVLDRARKGLYRSYVDESSSLAYVRGRIDIRETTRLLTGGTPAVHCHFQEHTSDLDENQILLWTLHTISRIGLAREEVKAQVRAARRVLGGAATLRPATGRECAGRLYSRLNLDYQPLHGLCRFFLEGAGPGIQHGEFDLIPFSVYMPGLFELFVAEWLSSNVPAEVRVKQQHKVVLRGTDKLEFKMDLVIFDRATNSPLAVLDTKYKDSTQPSQQDINQVVAYAVELGVKCAILVYPSILAMQAQNHVGDVVVHTASFGLAGDLQKAGQQFLARLRALLNI